MESSELRLNVKRLNRILSMMIRRMEKMNDDGRDIPIMWNKMHMFSSAQLAKIVAIKRGLEPELAGIIAALHDMGTIETKSALNHAETGIPIIQKFIDQYNSENGEDLGRITSKEKEIILHAVRNHSSKGEVTDMPYSELMKDVDSYDRYLHGVKTKGEHINRYEKVAEELGTI